MFVNAILAFLIIAFALFMIIKAINRLRRMPPPVPVAPPPTKSEELLGEIRDLLAKRA